MLSIQNYARHALFKMVFTILLTMLCGLLHGVCQHYYYMYCRSNILLFLMMDESTMCKMLHSVSSILEANASNKFSMLSGHVKNFYESFLV